MSRTEYNDDSYTSNVFDDDNRTTVFPQSYCAYCNDQHVKDQVGLLSVRYKVWFCSGGCQSLYLHDNKLVQYAPETVAVLIEMKKKFYNDKKHRR